LSSTALGSRICQTAVSLLFVLVASGLAEAAGPKPQKLAVFDVKAVGTFDPAAVKGLSALIASEAARFNARVLAGTDMVALIDLDRQKQMLGCSDSSCLTEIGGALGVDLLLTSEVSEVGGLWLISLSLLNVTRAQAIARLTRKAETPRELVNQTSIAVHELLQPVLGPPPGQAESVVPPATLPEVRPIAEKTPVDGASAAAQTPVDEVAGRRVAGIVLDSAGLAALAAGAIVGVLAKDAYDSADGLAAAGRPEEFEAFEDARDSAQTRMVVADVLYVAGALALGAGLYLTFTDGDSEGARLSAAPKSDGGMLVFSGGF